MTKSSVQITNEMPKQVRHDKPVILNSFQNLILDFDIWILKFLFHLYPIFVTFSTHSSHLPIDLRINSQTSLIGPLPPGAAVM